MDLIDYFPKQVGEPRQVQIDALKQIQEGMNSGYKKFILCAPTGSGKSAIAISLANYLGSSFIVTSSKQLQNQYSNDFGYPVIKGKSNFICPALMNQNNCKSNEEAFRLGFTANVGNCFDRKEKTSCSLKPLFQTTPLQECSCPYYFQKHNGLVSKISILNYDFYFQLLKMKGKSPYLPFIDKSLVIYDEAHLLEDKIVKYISFEVYDSYFKKVNLNYDDLKRKDPLDIIITLSDKVTDEITQLEKLTNNEQDLAKLKMIQIKLTNLIDEYEIDKENFIIDRPKDTSVRLHFKPIKVKKFFSRIDNPYQIFMSATIHKKFLSETLGFDSDECQFIEITKSSFLEENRLIAFIPTVRMTKDTPLDEKKKLYNTIDKILTLHSKQRGLILTSSKNYCWEILNSVSSKNKKRIKIITSATFDEDFDEHKRQSNSVILSPSLWEGIDLKGDLSEFQIIAKAPYPSLEDSRVRKLIHNDNDWFNYLTLQKFLQGCGRSIRSELDKVSTYVLDTKLLDLVLKYKETDYIPEVYKSTFRSATIE